MARGHSLSEFQNAFPDEAHCVAFLFKCRWPSGFVCPACGKARGAALNSRPRLYECLDCGRQTSITAGTGMERSKLHLTTWVWAAHLRATHSNGISARQLEDQLGVTYKTAWLLTQKLRRSMVDPNRTVLEGVVEVDQAEIPVRVGDSSAIEFWPSSADGFWPTLWSLNPTVAPIGSGDLAWTGKPKWICSNNFVGSMSLALARSRVSPRSSVS